MASVKRPKAKDQDYDAIRREWLEQLEALADDVIRWASEADWSTRKIQKTMEDSRLGADPGETYKAPAVLLQKETVRILLEPITRFAPGVDGVVDLYLMPAYDDIVNLYLVDGVWEMHYMFNRDPEFATTREAGPVPLGPESLRRVLDALSRHAS